MMNGILGCKFLLDQFLRPSCRIIVDPEEPGLARLQARMVEEREVSKAELGSNVGEQPAQVRVGDASACFLLEQIDKTRALAGACRGRTANRQRSA
jgi:hypothetical protein